MSTHFYADGENMLHLKSELSSIQLELQNSYNDAKKIYDEIASKETWKGNAELVTEGFLDLLLQYHDALAKSGGPLSEAREHISSYEGAVDTFFEDFEGYKDLKGVEYELL